MRKLTILISTVFIFCCSIVLAQSTNNSPVNLDKSYQKASQKNGFFALGGYAENGYGLLTGFKYFTNKNLDRHYEISGYAGFIEENKTGYDIPIEVFSLNLGYFISVPYLSSQTNAFQFSIGAGGIIGQESIDKSKIQLQPLESISTKDGTVYGLYGAMEVDIKLFKHLSVIGRYTHFYHPNSEIGKTKFLLGAGLIIKL